MGERGAAEAAFESMTDLSQQREEPTVPGTERKAPTLRLVKEKELRRETSVEYFFTAGVESLRKQKRGPKGWIDVDNPNEDAVEIDSKMGLALVADGFGGHAKGDKASAAAASAMKTTVRRELEEPFFLTRKQQKPDVDPELRQARVFVEDDLKLDPSRFADEKDVERALRQGLVSANDAVKKETKEGGTTMSAVLVYETVEGARRAKIINRGDSRVYLYRRGQMRQLTKDDSYVQELQDRKLLVGGDDEDVDAKIHFLALEYLKKIDMQGAADGDYAEGTKLRQIRNVVTKGLSAQDKQVERTPVVDVPLEEGDLLLEVSDGVIDNLTRLKTAEVIQGNATRSPQDVARELAVESKAVAHSKDPRAKEDDATASVQRIEAGRPLKVILEGKLDEWKRTLQHIEDPNELEKNVLPELYVVRNQLEFAAAGHPENKKLAALGDHVLARLQLLDSRVRELRKNPPAQAASEDASRFVN